MLSWPPTVRIFLCSDATDMRKGFDSLAQLVESSLALDPLSGHLYVFRSRRGDRIKILYWDRDGYAMWYKKYQSDCTPPCLFTGNRAHPHNRAGRPVTAGRMG
jgi:transposase